MEESETAEALAEELRRVRDGLGVAPRTVDMGKHGRFEPALYAEVFGSWDEALEAAGIDGEPEEPPDGATVPGYREDEVVSDDGASEDGDEGLEHVARCADRVEGVPTPGDLRERGYSVNAVLDEHGTWKKVLEAAGVETEYTDGSPGARRERDDEPLLEEVRRYTRLRGEKPSTADVRSAGWMSSVGDYEEEYGGVGEAVEEAVGESGAQADRGAGETTADELVSEVERYYLRNREPPDTEDVRATGWMSSVEEYSDVFGGVEGAVDAAGVADETG